MVGVVGSSPIVPTKIHETEFEKSNSVLFFALKKLSRTLGMKKRATFTVTRQTNNRVLEFRQLR